MDCQTQHGLAKEGVVSEGEEAERSDRGNETRTYRLVFPARAGPRP